MWHHGEHSQAALDKKLLATPFCVMFACCVVFQFPPKSQNHTHQWVLWLWHPSFLDPRNGSGKIGKPLSGKKDPWRWRIHLPWMDNRCHTYEEHQQYKFNMKIWWVCMCLFNGRRYGDAKEAHEPWWIFRHRHGALGHSTFRSCPHQTRNLWQRDHKWTMIFGSRWEHVSYICKMLKHKTFRRSRPAERRDKRALEHCSDEYTVCSRCNSSQFNLTFSDTNNLL